MTLADFHDVEARVTDPSTGGMKGQKLTQLGALDPLTLIELARVAGMGANKYDDHNFLKGYVFSSSFNAMMRHALLFWAGEDRDEESGRLHMAHAAWNALTLCAFVLRGIGTDNRPPRLEGPTIEDNHIATLLRLEATGIAIPLDTKLRAIGVDPDAVHALLAEGASDAADAAHLWVESWGEGDGEVVEPLPSIAYRQPCCGHDGYGHYESCKESE